MADFGGHKSTRAGQNLQAKLFSTMRPLVYSCVKVGDGQLGAKVIADLTTLVHTRLTLEITATPTRNQDGRWNITGVLSNRELTEPLKFREWGVFAHDPDTDIDVLVAYANAGESADIINPWDGSTISTLIEEEITCACLVTGDLQVDAIIIDPTQLYVPRAVFDEHNHDDRYYSKEEVSTQLGEKADLSGAAFTGAVVIESDAAYESFGISNTEGARKISIGVGGGESTPDTIWRVYGNDGNYQQVTVSADKKGDILIQGFLDGALFSGSIWNEFKDAIPALDNKVDVGSAAKRIKQIYAANATINTSDERQKTDISPIPNPTSFIMALKPIRYKLIDGTSGRYHNGMGALAVKEAMDSVGLTDIDFAGWIASPKLDDDGNPTGDYSYGLRYSEFIAPLIATVQEQQKRLDTQDARMDKLESILADMQALQT